MKEFAEKIKALGVDVYQPKEESSYCFYSDGKSIGYAEETNYGISIGTVHVPNHKSGNGFTVVSSMPLAMLTKEQLEQGFKHHPTWANYLKDSVKKWKDINAFLASSDWYKSFKQM